MGTDGKSGNKTIKYEFLGVTFLSFEAIMLESCSLFLILIQKLYILAYIMT